MTLILMVATVALLAFLGLSCRQAQLDLQEQICDCLHAAVPAAVGFGAAPVEIGPAGPVLVPLDGGRAGAGAPRAHRHRHLRVVRAG
jgi:hypothetical protein